METRPRRSFAIVGPSQIHPHTRVTVRHRRGDGVASSSHPAALFPLRIFFNQEIFSHESISSAIEGRGMDQKETTKESFNVSGC